MKKYICLLCIALCGCITDYVAKEIEEVSDILVVDGIIAEDETYITLSRSLNLSDNMNFTYVDNARVYVECEDGTQMEGKRTVTDSSYYNKTIRYLIKTGTLSLEHRYRLKIEINEPDDDCVDDGVGSCPTKIYKYSSEYSYPIKTPEIDSVFWIKTARGKPVMIYVSTHSLDGEVLYYRWSYQEDWEIQSEVYLYGYPFYCWNKANSNVLLIGSAEKTVFGQLTDKIVDINPSSMKLSVKYRINVKQNAIGKRAYDYFANIKKNILQTSSIFAPVPSELRGNIICDTDPSRPVIGYVDISTTAQKHIFISGTQVWEPPYVNCDFVSLDSLLVKYNNTIPDDYVFFSVVPPGPPFYVPVRCVDCTFYGTEQEPPDWPPR